MQRGLRAQNEATELGILYSSKAATPQEKERASRPLSSVNEAARSGVVVAGEGVQQRRYRGLLCVLTGLAIFACYIAILQRAALVRKVPSLAGAFQLAGLPVNLYQAEFKNVRASLSVLGDDTQLIVEGEIKNLRSGNNTVPDIQLSLVGDNGVSGYSWIARLPQKTLKGGEHLGFKTSLDMPPMGKHQVAVSFVR